MTYGVYTRTLHIVKTQRRTLEDAKRLCRRDDEVVCSEKRFWCSSGIEFLFHAWRGFHHHRVEQKLVLGFVTIKTSSNYFTWADKIVFDPKAGGEAK